MKNLYLIFIFNNMIDDIIDSKFDLIKSNCKLK